MIIRVTIVAVCINQFIICVPEEVQVSKLFTLGLSSF